MSTQYSPAGEVTEAADLLARRVIDKYDLVGACALCGKIGGWLRNHVMLWPYNAADGGPSPYTYVVVVVACEEHSPEDVAMLTPPQPDIK